MKYSTENYKDVSVTVAIHAVHPYKKSTMNIDTQENGNPHQETKTTQRTHSLQDDEETNTTTISSISTGLELKQDESNKRSSTTHTSNDTPAGETVMKPARHKKPLLDKFRRKFHEHHAKIKGDESLDREASPNQSQKIHIAGRFKSKFHNGLKVVNKSHIGRFRSQFHHNHETPKRKSHVRRFRSLSHYDHELSRGKSHTGRARSQSQYDPESSKSKSHFDGFRSKLPSYFGGSTRSLPGESKAEVFEGRDLSEELVKLSSVQPSANYQCDKLKLKNVSNENKEKEDAASESVHKELKEKQSCLSLFYIIQHSQLIAVSLQRAPGEDWGLELIRDDNSCSSVLRQNDKGIRGRERSVDSTKSSASNSVIDKPPASAFSSESNYGHLVAAFRQSVRRKSAPNTNRVMKTSHSSPAKEGSFQPRHGVRIAGLAEEGMAARGGELAVEDLIVEVGFNFDFVIC